jgi:peptidoglycan/LPS O-acetylase OafA/YrhL
MEHSQASEHLQVIRTLMERSAIYRRALGPVLIYSGLVGLVAAAVGWVMKVYQPVHFILYYYIVASLVLAGALVLVRRQALRSEECFWSPPTRRVTAALFPPLTAGALIGLLWILGAVFPNQPAPSGGWPPSWAVLVGLPCLWAILAGCAFHAASFFTPRPLRWLGWSLIICGVAGFVIGAPREEMGLVGLSHTLMGAYFGVLHLAWGVYLRFTETASPPA